MENPEVHVGDHVKYKQGRGEGGGTVSDVATEGQLSIETSKGKEVHKNATEENPAVHIEREKGEDVVKRVSELTEVVPGVGTEKEGEKEKEKGEEKEKMDDKKEDTMKAAETKEGDKQKEEQNEDKTKEGLPAQTGEKRERPEEVTEAEEKEAERAKEKEPAKRTKTTAPKKTPAKRVNAPRKATQTAKKKVDELGPSVSEEPEAEDAGMAEDTAVPSVPSVN